MKIDEAVAAHLMRIFPGYTIGLIRNEFDRILTIVVEKTGGGDHWMAAPIRYDDLAELSGSECGVFMEAVVALAIKLLLLGAGETEVRHPGDGEILRELGIKPS